MVETENKGRQKGRQPWGFLGVEERFSGGNPPEMKVETTGCGAAVREKGSAAAMVVVRR